MIMWSVLILIAILLGKKDKKEKSISVCKGYSSERHILISFTGHSVYLLLTSPNRLCCSLFWWSPLTKSSGSNTEPIINTNQCLFLPENALSLFIKYRRVITNKTETIYLSR